MKDDELPECPYGLYVKFNYDYNTMRADMFPDHVGHIRLNVYDEEGKLAAQRIISNSGDNSPLKQHGYTVYFPNSELPTGHSYRLQAVGMQKDWDEAVATPGAKYRRSEETTVHDHHIRLDYAAPTTPFDCGHHEVSYAAPLDTLWHTLKVMTTEPLTEQLDPGVHTTSKPYTLHPIEEQRVRVEAERYTYATVALMRDTKELNITLRQVDDPTNVFDADYEVLIVDDNTHLDGNNELVEEQTVHYAPHSAWTTRYLSDGSVELEDAAGTRADGDKEVVQRTAHYDLMFNRIMYQNNSEVGGRLIVRNRKTGISVVEMSLPQILAHGRSAYELQNYSPQEYLDREHEYRLDFLLKGDKWEMLSIQIDILSWAMRIYNTELGQ